MSHDRDRDLDLDRDLGLDAWTVPPPPADLVDRVMDRIAGTGLHAVGAREPVAAGAARRWPWIASTVAGFAAAAAALAYAATRPAAVREAAAPAAGRVAAAAPSTLTLAPGIDAELDARGAIDWRAGDDGALHVRQTAGAVTYRNTGDRRLVVDAGAAHVEAGRGRFHLEVPMNDGKLQTGAIMTALATAVVVSVYDGHVALMTAAGRVELDRGAIGMAVPGQAPTRLDLVAGPPSPHSPPPTTPRRLGPGERAVVMGDLAAALVYREPRANAADHAPRPLAPDDAARLLAAAGPLLNDCAVTWVPDGDLEKPIPNHLRGGQLHVRAIITGEVGVGAIADGVTIVGGDPDMTADQHLVSCVAQTLVDSFLPPPTTGGSSIVDHVFTFPTLEGDSTVSPARQRQLLDAAKDAAKDGKWDVALVLADRAVQLDPDSADARMVAALAACNTKRADEAREHIAHLGPSRAAMAAQSCKRNGLDVDVEPAGP